jgi:CPA1 family monovalent cation:H+ antiporter
MEQFLQAETLIIELLLVASLVAMAVQRFRVPYTVALVVVGLLITFQQPVALEATPELILALFVPPLVFEAAFHLNLVELRRNLLVILLLAVPGVLLSTLISGALLSWFTALAFPAAVVFGALIAATDPVAVVALFRAIGVPKRLAVLIEGESLLNDGTAIVIFNLAVAAALTGHFSLVEGVVEFVRVSAGGVLIGVALGWLTAQVIARVDDYLIETTLTTVLAFGAYLAAERLHFSGVLAVVAAGLVNGNLGPRGMSPTTRIVLFNFWEYVAFLANSLVFLLIGLQVNIPSLAAAWQPMLWAVAAVLISRAMVVYGFNGLTALILRWRKVSALEAVPARWQHVLVWGGLRGAISLALALSLPAALGSDRALIRTLAFGVALFTLLVQGVSMSPLVRRLNIAVRREAQAEYELRHARLTALRAAEQRLDELHREGLLSAHTWESLKPALTARVGALADDVRAALRADASLEAQEAATARREMLHAERSALSELLRSGVIVEDVYARLSAEVDAQLADISQATLN